MLFKTCGFPIDLQVFILSILQIDLNPVSAVNPLLNNLFKPVSTIYLTYYQDRMNGKYLMIS